MISYYLVDPDQDSSKYQKLGEISESKFKKFRKIEKTNSLKKKIQLRKKIIKTMKSLLKKKSSLTIHKNYFNN